MELFFGVLQGLCDYGVVEWECDLAEGQRGGFVDVWLGAEDEPSVGGHGCPAVDCGFIVAHFEGLEVREIRNSCLEGCEV